MHRKFALCAAACLSSYLLAASHVVSAQAIPAAAVPSTAVADRYAYALVINSSQKQPVILGYSINPQTGYLRSTGPAFPGAENVGIVIDPSNQFLYLPNGPFVNGYRITANGVLQALKGSPFSVDCGDTMIFNPNGKFAYCNLGYELSLNTTTGALAQIGSVDPDGSHFDLAITPSGSFVYILNKDESISAFAADPTTGLLTEVTGSPFATGNTDGLNSSVVSPDGKFLFAASGGIPLGMTSVLSINATTGAITPVTGSPFVTAGGIAVVNSTSQFLYVGGEELGAYSINSTTGALTAITGSPYTLPVTATSITLDPTGKFVYATLDSTPANSNGTPGIITYSINATTGALTRLSSNGDYGNQVDGVAIAGGSKAVIYTPKFAYAANQGGKSISEWTIKDSTGALTAVAGSPISDANGPKLVATTPSGAFVYTGNSNNSVSEYSVNATTGALTLVSGSPLTGFGSVNTVAVDPTSTYLSVLDSAKTIIDIYAINQKTGALTLATTTTTPANSQTLALDPTDIAAAVAGATSLHTYGVNSSTISASNGSVNLANPAAAAAFDQSAQYIFVAEAKSNSVVTFNVYNSEGALSQLSSASTGNNPGAVLAEQSGKYVYVANTGDGTISAYTLNRSTGALTAIGAAIAAAAGTDALATSNDGKYLYATNGTAGLVSIFKINSNGTLTASGTATTGVSPTSIATTGTHQ